MKLSDSHKVTIPSKNRVTLEKITEVEEVDVSKLTDHELFLMRNELDHWYQEQRAIIQDEIERWEPIYCAVCGQEDLAFRGRPFITWGLRGGRTLCPKHLWLFDHMGDHKRTKQEEAEIKEIFG